MHKRIETTVLEDFYVLVDYLSKQGKIKNIEKYKNNFPAFLVHARHIKTYDLIAPFCKNRKVLDIGCFIGYGETRIYTEACSIIAIDSDSKAIKFAQENRKLPNVKFENLDAENLPYPDNWFDVIIASQIIEHIHPNQIVHFLSNVKRLLNQDGLFFVITPNKNFRLLPWQKPFNKEHYQEFTYKELLKILKPSFSNVQIKGLRAVQWIEEIEKTRVYKTPVTSIKKTVRKVLKLLQLTKQTSANLSFDNLFSKFSMNEFFLVDQKEQIKKSIELFGVCKKDN
ncbi:MAG: class I SAM-dependent methyltransferase [Candidatus Ratteibacteria bacterium]